jgi:hypothetical protein
MKKSLKHIFIFNFRNSFEIFASTLERDGLWSEQDDVFLEKENLETIEAKNCSQINFSKNLRVKKNSHEVSNRSLWVDLGPGRDRLVFHSYTCLNSG